MSNFSYKDGKGNVIQVPVRYGDMNRQVAQILAKNSENIVQSAPFIACYIKGMDFARDRLQDPTYISKVNIRERAYDEQGQEYLNTQGANYTVERLMPTPFNLQFTADIWTTNTDQKLQLLEQILVLFAPAMEIQTNNNYIDWTSLTMVELIGMTFSSRSIPQGLEQDIDIANLNFNTPIWLTTPAKVKKLGIITKIITSIFDDASGTIASGAYDDATTTDYFTGRTSTSVGVTTLGNLGLLVLDGTAKLVRPENSKIGGALSSLDVPSKTGAEVNWNSILEIYPGRFTAGLSQLRVTKPNGSEIIFHIGLHPADENVMVLDPDTDTLPATDVYIDAIINPETFNPRPVDINGTPGWATVSVKYLILEDIDSTPVIGPKAWQNQDGSGFTAKANDIVGWDPTSGTWSVIFNSSDPADVLFYATNLRTGIQYSWDGTSWMKSFEGIYDPGSWRLVL